MGQSGARMDAPSHSRGMACVSPRFAREHDRRCHPRGWPSRHTRGRAHHGRSVADRARVHDARRRLDRDADAVRPGARRMAVLDLDSGRYRMAESPPSDNPELTGALPETERDRRHQETEAAAWYATLGVIAFATVRSEERRVGKE